MSTYVDFRPKILLHNFNPLLKQFHNLTYTTAQWCIFNKYSLDKHRHETWQWFHFYKNKWKLKYKREFCHNSLQKLENWHLSFFWWISKKWNKIKNPWSFEKKNHFSYLKKIIQRHIVISKFQELHFCFLTIFNFKVLEVYFDLCLFFLMNKNFTFQKTACWFFSCKTLDTSTTS